MTVRAISGNIALLCNTCELSYLISSEVSGSKYFQKLDLDTNYYGVLTPLNQWWKNL
jgi:hypothetical protein